MIKNKFAENLKEVMYENSITQTYLANKLGVRQQTVSNWLKGYNEPDFTTLLRICELLNSTPNKLFDYEETSEDYNNKINVSDDERYILNEYKKLTSLDKQRIVSYMAVCNTKVETK